MIAYKYRSGRGLKDESGNDLFDRDIQLLSQDRIYVPTIGQLNDPAEALVDDHVFKTLLGLFRLHVQAESFKRVETVYDEFREKIRFSGVFSLSKAIDNELMWAYYASGHSGYAVIWDTEVLSSSYGKGNWGGMYELDVEYSDRLPVFDITRVGNEPIEKTLACFIGRKSKAWKHEKEHRLVFDKGGTSLRVDYRALKGFVFGCRMAREDIDTIMRLFSGRDLQYYRIDLKENTYHFTVRPLEDMYPTEEKYCPNKVEYDIEELLESDKLIGGVGYKYRSFVEEALRRVCRNPFVIGISHIVVSDDSSNPSIMVWTRVDQDDSLWKMRSYEYDIVDARLVDVDCFAR